MSIGQTTILTSFEDVGGQLRVRFSSPVHDTRFSLDELDALEVAVQYARRQLSLVKVRRTLEQPRPLSNDYRAPLS